MFLDGERPEGTGGDPKTIVIDLYMFMGEFRDFLEAGGAFGKSRFNAFDFSKKPSFDDIEGISHLSQRDANKFQDIRTRVDFGRKMESKIIESLRKSGWEISDPKPSQDMRDKIDGWAKRDSKWVPLQIKYRDTGDEISMETMRNWDESRFEYPLRFDGRDMVGGAKLYVCLNKSGTMIRICSADEAKKIAKEGCEKLAKEFKNKGIKRFESSDVVNVITRSPSDLIPKVMSFVKPHALKSLELIPVHGDKSLWAA